MTFSALAERLPAAVAAEAADAEPRRARRREGAEPPTGDQSEGSARGASYALRDDVCCAPKAA